jgi:hypothetical protein
MSLSTVTADISERTIIGDDEQEIRAFSGASGVRQQTAEQEYGGKGWSHHFPVCCSQ